MPKTPQERKKWVTKPSSLLPETSVKDVFKRGKEVIEEWRRQWRLHRKLSAKSKPLEFCLRPHLALLLYTLGVSLLGRGLTHLSGESPYWSLWWDEELASLFTWLISDSWYDYSTDPRVESMLMTLQNFLMWSYLVLGVVALYAPRRLSQSLRSHGHASSLELQSRALNRKTKEGKKVPLPSTESSITESQRLAEPPRSAKLFSRICWLATALQVFYTFSLWSACNYRWATLSEHTLHIALPLTCALMLPYTPQEWEMPAERILRATLSLCFIGHGLYALNISPTPQEFLVMTMNIMKVSESSAHYFLYAVGLLDLIAALFIWLPVRELRRSALYYMIIWGSLTALARPMGLPAPSLLDRMITWGPEATWRLSHALTPLWLWFRTYR